MTELMRQKPMGKRRTGLILLWRKSRVNDTGGLKMTSDLLKPEAQKTSRRYELDLLKALAIISMILCHPVLRLGLHIPGYENDFFYFLGQDIFGNYLGVAHAFMFAMGFGIVFSRKSTPKDLMLRGVKLYLLGYVLNFLRYGMYNLTEAIFTGEFRSDILQALFGMDILQFAGLALIFTGVLKKLKLREFHMLAIAGALSVIGSVIPEIDTGNYAGNWLIGHFVFTNSDACAFVFFNWYIFVAVGILFGSILKKSADLDGLYKKVLTISFPIMVLYIVMTVVKGVLFLTKDGWYYAVSPLEAMGLLSIDFVMIGAFYFLLKRIDEAKVAPFITMSRNLTKIYIIHWCIIGFVDSIFCYLLEIVFPYTIIYIFAFALIFVSYWIARWWEMKMRAISPGMTSTES